MLDEDRDSGLEPELLGTALFPLAIMGLKVRNLHGFTALICLVLCLSACTVTTFRGFDGSQKLSRVCIIDNSDSEVPDLIATIESRIAAHGIVADVVSSDRECVHTLEFVATMSGETGSYLDYADFSLRENQEILGKVKYRDRGGPPEKRTASLPANINPIIDELLGLEGLEGLESVKGKDRERAED